MKDYSSHYISVIIPVYNDSLRLKKCIESLLNQNYDQEKYEIIIIDNNSEEDIGEICSYFKDNKVIYLEEKKKGSYAARNRGLTIARGSLVGFTDSDCIVDSNWLKNAIIIFENQKCDLIGGRIELFFKNPQKPTPVELYDKIFGFQQEENVKKRNVSVTANLFVKEEVFNKIGYFNDNLFSGGDVELCRRAYINNFKICYSPNTLVKHPARHSLTDLKRKTRRVVGGMYVSNKKKLFIKIVTPPVMRVMKVLFKKEFSVSQKLGIIRIIFVINFIRFSEFFRILITKE